MIDDPDIKAIFIARGGYGTSRILDKIDFRNMVKYPKWVCGFSDVTVLQLHLFNLNFSSLHCPMPAFFHVVDKNSIDRMHDVLFGKNIPVTTKSHKLNTPGNANGRIIGGNLSMICHTLGTKTEIETDGRILFLEEVGESLYKIDRMMVQLKRSGKLKGIKGLIVGQFSEIDPMDDAFGKDVNEIIHDHIEPGKYPVAYDFPIGHTNLNYTIPIGAKAELIVKENVDVTLTYRTE
jgi:muramoyltetrapeptide carboxypeptidase